MLYTCNSVVLNIFYILQVQKAVHLAWQSLYSKRYTKQPDSCLLKVGHVHVHIIQLYIAIFSYIPYRFIISTLTCHFELVSLVCVWITTENGGPWSVQITTENGGPWSLCVGVPGLCLDYN